MQRSFIITTHTNEITEQWVVGFHAETVTRVKGFDQRATVRYGHFRTDLKYFFSGVFAGCDVAVRSRICGKSAANGGLCLVKNRYYRALRLPITAMG